MVGLFHENWSGTTLHEQEPQSVSFTVARKPVSHAHDSDIVETHSQQPRTRPRAKTLGPRPQPLGTPIRRVPVSDHSRANSEETIVCKEDLKLPIVEGVGKLEMDVDQFHCFTPVLERDSYL